MTSARRLLLVLAVSALAFVACEDASGDSAASTATVAATATLTTATPAMSPPATEAGATAATAVGPTTTVTPSTVPTVATPSPTATPAGPVASTFTIPTPQLPVVRFIASGDRIADLPIEVPPQAEYGIGLSGRSELVGRGMLFYYPDESGGPGFWMRGTFIDLDIAFVSEDGTIIAIDQMQAETEEIHHPGREYTAGVEAPAGWYAEHGIAAGDRYEFLFDPDELLGLD